MIGGWPAAVDLSSVSRSAQDSRGVAEYAGILLAALAIVALCWLLVFLWDRYRRELRRAAHDPRALFRELCRAHRLSRRERGLLWRAAVHLRLEHPALIFALPHFVNRLADSALPESRDYAGLALRLFGSLASGETAQPGDQAASSGGTSPLVVDAAARVRPATEPGVAGPATAG
ncbi:MAG TPA: hypothetical protein VML55_19860 [Planctomycetaceae bacterium]|nr:hypothetical protein [Planctomycetaceae bacterium]